MPRSASAGASLRKATQFSAVRGSPAARAREAVPITELEVPSPVASGTAGGALGLAVRIRWWGSRFRVREGACRRFSDFI